MTLAVVPDTLKSGVSDPWHYDPVLNPSYADWARHDGVAILPARIRRAKNKAKVERHVLEVERAVFAPLRNLRFRLRPH